MKRIELNSILILVCLILLPGNFELLAQRDTTKSLAFKRNRPPVNTPFYFQPDLSYQLLQQFRLMKEANAGDPLAQHELGLRYLVGEGMTADTIEGAKWIRKAALSKLTAAQYNYAILLLNGWGVKWNPFEAFDNLLEAAQSGMAMAQFLTGILYTDDLIVQRDFTAAYSWIKRAYDAGYEPAAEVLLDIQSKIENRQIDTSGIKMDSDSQLQEDHIASSIGLVYIDFDAVLDTIPHVDDNMLVRDLLNSGNEKLADTLKIKSKSDTLVSFTAENVKALLSFADYGSPEALTLLGRMYEKGEFFKENLIAAAAYYIRAVILDSYRAAVLLYKLQSSGGFRSELRNRAAGNDPEALFVWYGLYSLGYDNSIVEQDAINLLRKSAANGYIPALVELGLNYYTGRMTETNIDRAFLYWQNAISAGNQESFIRILAARIFDDASIKVKDEEIIGELIEAASTGSLLAQVLLAYCYENGKLVEVNRALSAKYYRFAAQRGSKFAFDELRRLYNEMRPDSGKYSIN